MWKMGEEQNRRHATSRVVLNALSYYSALHMAADWKSYLCRVNNSLASIMVDLSLRHTAPDYSRPWLAWVWVCFKRPRRDGLSHRNEAPVLFAIEDALAPRVEQSCSALLAGRITTGGRREFYFYAATKNSFRDAVKSVLAQFPDYEFDVGTKEDRDWEQYLEVLFPSEENLERIKNRDVIDLLTEKGDVLTTVREVSHWAYFGSSTTRSLFKDATVALGFRITSDDLAGDRPLSFGISFSRVDSVQQEVIDTITIQLLHLCRRFAGEYDGWEAQVVQQ